jgi:hypothetical protein
MPRGTQLVTLVSMFRDEVGMSSNVGQGVNVIESIKGLLRRTQNRLYEDNDWPFMVKDVSEALVTDGRYYTFDATINFDRIIKADVKYSDSWRPLQYGIGVEQYNAQDSDDGVTNDPALCWQHYGVNQYEVWPVPASNDQTIRFRAYRKLSALVADSDTADLDDNLIVLYAAAEWCLKNGSADAEAKQAAAQNHYKNLKGNANKQKMFVNGGGLIYHPMPMCGRKIP